MRKLPRGGFTLVELLVVLAITSILMLLVFGPVVQSFNLTREARAEAEAQSTARLVIEQLSTELGNAVYVRDNSRPEAALMIPLPLTYFVPAATLGNNLVPLQYAKIDFFPPSQGDPSVNGRNFNPYIRKADPTLSGGSPIGRLELPMARGIAMVRYFVGLQDPAHAYANGSEDKLVSAATGDNLFVLYRAEVRPFNDDGSVNTAFFDADTNGQPMYDDPIFFTYVPNAQGTLGSAAHLTRVMNWYKASNVVSQLQATDLIQIVRDRKTKNIVIDEAGNPQVRSLMTFQPMLVGDEPASPDNTTVAGEEAPNRTPTGFTTKYGGWGDQYMVTIWPSGATPGANVSYYSTVDRWVNSESRYHKILYFDNPGALGRPGAADTRLDVFDLTLYADTLLAGNPSFTAGVLLPQGSAVNLEGFVVDPVSGKIVTDVPSTHVLPVPVRWAAGAPTTYVTDTQGNPLTINGRLDLLYNVHPGWGRRIDRYIALGKEQDSPLARWANASIVPNSEAVTGPDELPGPHYGLPIRYRRVSANSMGPGPNEYQINYASLLPRPGQYPDLGPDMLLTDNDVKTYILPRFDAGYIKFNSDPNYPMPGSDNPADPGATPVTVTYHFQLNDPGSVVTVNYVTKEVLMVSLAIRRYDISSGNGHMAELTNRVHVRNFLK